MPEVKKCIKSLAVYYLLLATTILLETGMIPIQFPTYRFSTVYLLFLSVCLIMRYYLLVAGRKNVKYTMMHIAVMIFLLIFFPWSQIHGFRKCFRTWALLLVSVLCAYAVKHAQAKMMKISFIETWIDIQCTFENDGDIPAGDIRFTGGLANLSVLAAEQNAAVSVETDERFRLTLIFPKNR